MYEENFYQIPLNESLKRINLNIKPGTGVGKCLFGTLKNLCINYFGTPLNLQNRQGAGMSIASYNKFALYFDENDKFDAIEIFLSTKPKIIINKMQLPTEYEKLLNFLKSKDSSIRFAKYPFFDHKIKTVYISDKFKCILNDKIKDNSISFCHNNVDKYI